jgi:hypothetical protein
MDEQGATRHFCFCHHLLFVNWKPQHVMIRLFKANDTIGAKLKALLEKFGFTLKVLCCVKDEGTNLGTMTTTLKSIISWEALNLSTPFNGTCFWHAMNKIVQYVTTNDKVSKDLGTININA